MKTLNRLAISENWLKQMMGICFDKTGLQDPHSKFIRENTLGRSHLNVTNVTLQHIQ